MYVYVWDRKEYNYSDSRNRSTITVYCIVEVVVLFALSLGKVSFGRFSFTAHTPGVQFAPLFRSFLCARYGVARCPWPSRRRLSSLKSRLISERPFTTYYWHMSACRTTQTARLEYYTNYYDHHYQLPETTNRRE